MESEPKPKKKIGRPRRGDRKAPAHYSPTVGGENQGEEEEEDLWDDTSASSLLPDNVSKMPGRCAKFGKYFNVLIKIHEAANKQLQY